MTITTWPATERPQEKLIAYGAKHLSDAELLAIFLHTGTRGQTAVDIARGLLQHFGNVKKLLDASQQHLLARPGIGLTKYVRLQAAIELGFRYWDSTPQIGEAIGSAAQAKRFITQRLRHYPHEVFACLFLNSRHRLLGFEILFQGTIHEANVYPREVVKRGLAYNAAKLIMAHNHPSGDPTPSQADRDVTQLLKEALTLIDIQLVDHVVVGHHHSLSFTELGYL